MSRTAAHVHPPLPHRQSFFQEFTIVSSQIGDLRPLSHCAFSPEGSVLAVASWSGLVKLWSMPACDELMAFRGHTDRVSGIAWHPQALRGQTETALQLASCGIDGYIHLYNRTQFVTGTGGKRNDR